MADDDKNDKLMEQFIAKATPKLLEAMTTQITEQVETQIKPLVDNSTKMLDQIQDAKRERAKQAEDFGQLKTLLERGDSPADIKKTLNPDPIVLTRDQARDPALYRRAKAQAEANGTVVKIAVDGDA